MRDPMFFHGRWYIGPSNALDRLQRELLWHRLGLGILATILALHLFWAPT